MQNQVISSDSSDKNQNNEVAEQNQSSIKKVFIILVIFVAVILSLIYFRFLHSYKANHYDSLLRIGMSFDSVQHMIPEEIYYRRPYPHPMRQPKTPDGSEVWWLFEDGSLLKTDFNDTHGLRTFEVDKSRTFAGGILNAIPGIIMFITIIFFLRKIMRP